MKVELLQHQKAAIKRARGVNLLLAHEPGTGKTLSILEIFREKRERTSRTAVIYDEFVSSEEVARIAKMNLSGIVLVNDPAKIKEIKMGDKLKMLVVCPILCIENAWIPQIQKFTDFTYSVIYDKSPKRRLEKLHSNADIHLVNTAQFKILSNAIREQHYDMLVVDESSCMKNHKSITTKCLLSFAGIRSKNYQNPVTIPHRYCMSGTPAPNDRNEYWAQITFCQFGLFHQNFFAFRDRFFYSIPMGPGMRKWVFKNHMATEFETTMAPAIDVVRKNDALDLPGIVDQYYNVDLSKIEADKYKQMKEELVVEFGDVTVLSQYQITKIQKLRQLACGFVFDLDHKDHWVVDKTSKDEVLLEILDKLAGRSVVIWVDFRPLFLHLHLLLGKKCGIIDKAYGDPEHTLKDFASGKLKIIVANPASCGHGIDGWQNVASEAIYYTDNWSLEKTEQSSGRLDRMGQKNKVTNYHIVARDTVDSLICQKVQDKKKLSDMVLNHLRGK